MINDLSRRNFLTRACGAVSALWLSAHWPAIVAAAEHAHQAAKSSAPPKFQFFTPEQATEIEAITARIIPSDETPGAHEAGVVYFIDRALTTFALDDQKTHREGLPVLQARVRELFPNLEKFSSATPEQQDQILHSLDEQADPARRHSRSNGVSSSFFQAVRIHTIVAFLIDPDSGGNRDGVGWKVIGRDREHMFQPPFGYYDKDYAGWQPNPAAAEKTKA
ncbi:MAG TPA: gluconate 2-dehydrogenase subunit 3 family protein [Candidatus Acidoferrum sp.]|nr:gluconate 2-dehydrogenase subunit 3 family protein [Candidatus Acidoferrum sp.]